MSWLNGWLYRKTNPDTKRVSGAVSNYQMWVLVGESSGSPGVAVHCDSHCKTDFSDLRFTKGDGQTLLDYWIESVTGTTPNQVATIVVEFDTIETADTPIYLYYGKADAPAVSSGANTFIVFDDFERGVDGDTVGGAWVEWVAHCHISTDHAYGGTRSLRILGGTLAACSLPVAHSENVAIRCRLWKENATPGIYLCHGDTVRYFETYFELLESIFYHDGSPHDTGYDGTPDKWELVEFNNFNWTAKTYDIVWNGATIKVGATMTLGGGVNDLFYLFIDSPTTGPDAYLDDVLVRNFRSTGPVWGTWGSEVTLAPPLLTDLLPGLNQTGVEIDESISFTLEAQSGDGVDIDTVTVQIRSVVYQKGDPEFSYVGDENSYAITVTHPNFGFEETISVKINASSLFGAAMEELDSNFTTGIEPRVPLLTGLVPGPGQTLVDVNRPVSFRLTAQGNDGVDIGSVTVQINSETYQDGDPEFSHTGSLSEYVITVTHPDWGLEETVTVKINASSLLDEAIDEKEYTFTTKWGSSLTRKGNGRIGLFEAGKYELSLLTIQEDWVRQGVARYTADLELWYGRYQVIPKADDVQLMVVAGNSVRRGSNVIQNGDFKVRIGGSGLYVPMYADTVIHLGGMYPNTKKLIGFELLVPEDAVTKGYVMFELQFIPKIARLWGQYPWGRGIYGSGWGVYDFHPDRIYYRAYVFDKSAWSVLETGIAAYPSYRGEDKQW